MDKKDEIEQLDMGLREPFSNKYKNLKYKVELFFVGLRTNSLFTAPFLWITTILSVSFVLIQNYYYNNFIERLPKEVPLFTIARSPELKLVNKDFLLWILVISIVLTAVSVFIAIKSYYKFKLISVFIMTNLVLGLLLLTISYIKIFSIYIF